MINYYYIRDLFLNNQKYIMNILNLSRKLLLLLTVAIFFACDKDNDDVKPDQPDDKPQTSAQEKLLKQNITISKLLLSITAHQEIKDN